MGVLKLRSKRRRVVVCPKCGFKFDVSYARAFSCAGCPSLVQCGMIKCPKCGHEFPSPYRVQTTQWGV